MDSWSGDISYNTWHTLTNDAVVVKPDKVQY